MRERIAVGSVYLGAFFVGLALLAQLWATGRLERTPLDFDATTRMDGVATIDDERAEVWAVRVTKADSGRSTADVAVFSSSFCLVEDRPGVDDCASGGERGGPVLSASLDTFAADRRTGVAVNDPDLLPPDAVPHEGIVAKFPFGVGRRPYSVWVPAAGRAVEAQPVGTERLHGVVVLVFRSSFASGRSRGTVELTVEPRTGYVVRERHHLTGRLEDGRTVDARFGSTEAAVRAAVGHAREVADRFRLVAELVPAVGYGAGVPLLVLGAVLLVLGRRKSS